MLRNICPIVLFLCVCFISSYFIICIWDFTIVISMHLMLYVIIYFLQVHFKLHNDCVSVISILKAYVHIKHING